MTLRLPRMAKRTDVHNLSGKMAAMLPKKMAGFIRRSGTISNSAGCHAFIVGGMVRDLLLGKKNLDLDIVVEGPAIKIGSMLAKELGAAIVIHKKFGTCSLYTKDKLKIDLATARRETYESPAALPTVEFSSLKEDLIRRDFTMNAMAVSINRKSYGQLIDPFGGQRDLSRGRIRILHDGSFIDDPTRIFRAVRFESRFGFAIDRRTERLIKNAIGQSMFDKVAPQRIRDELMLILQEAEPVRPLRRMAELDELRFIHNGLKLRGDIIRLCGVISGTLRWYDRLPDKKPGVDRRLIYLMALFDDLSYNTVLSLCRRFAFRGSDSARILSCKSRSGSILKELASKSHMAPSEIYKLLEPLSVEVILFMMAKAALSEPAARSKLVSSRIRNFLIKYNGTRIHIRGSDIKALGLKPSPEFKKILNKVLYNKIDGKFRTRRDELAYVKGLINLAETP
jgi:tRNA nucleotidyltransferase (CCA-adding enzyme)